MSIFNDSPEVEVRERRLHSIIAYEGTAKDLYEKSKDLTASKKDRCYSQCSGCMEGSMFVQVRDTALVFHAPVGCDAGVINRTIMVKGASAARGLIPIEMHMISTNLLEQDTIFGAAEKLKDTIREADKRFHPKAIFVDTSCASAIIGEDVDAIGDEMEKELGYPIVVIHCEGFKSKIWSSGFDANFHGILRKLVKPPKKKQEDLVNIFNFEGADTFTPLLSKMNLRVNYLISLTTLEQLAAMSEAACSSTICETLSLYAAAVLEEQYGVPEIKAAAPYGLDWTDAWLRAIGKTTNREDLAEKVIIEERAKYRSQIEDLGEKLEGKRVYVVAGDTFAHNMANIGKSLGLKLAGATSLHHDQRTDNPESINTLKALIETNGEIPNFTVCNFQPYQVVKILKNLCPDLLICRHPGLTVLGAKLGIPTLFEGDTNYSIGYEGVVRIGIRIYEALQTKKLVDNVARHSELPYTDWWLSERDAFYFWGGKQK
jgi:nitrogenase molybdenum-iron protein alpha chain